jgi:hypothetical protein
MSRNARVVALVLQLHRLLGVLFHLFVLPILRQIQLLRLPFVFTFLLLLLRDLIRSFAQRPRNVRKEARKVPPRVVLDVVVRIGDLFAVLLVGSILSLVRMKDEGKLLTFFIALINSTLSATNSSTPVPLSSAEVPSR